MIRVKKYIRILVINCAVLIGMLLLIEGAFRLIIPASEVVPAFSDQNRGMRGRPFVEANQTRGFALKPEFANRYYTVNSEGFRGQAFPKDLNRKHVILALGESTTFGWGVRDNETYPFYLEKCFSEKYRDVFVVNGGVPSYSSSQVLVALQETLAQGRIRPDLVLICILGNDVWYSSIANWHPDILVYQKPPQWVTMAMKYSRLGYACLMGFPKKSTQTNVFNAKALDKFKSNIVAMIDVCKSHGVRLAFVEPPLDSGHLPKQGLDRFQIRYTRDYLVETISTYVRSVREVAEKYGVPVIDHSLGLNHKHQKGLFRDSDFHPTPKGNAMMARDVYAGIVGADLLPMLKNQNK
jgi:lysophospholipase L1-like esterase